MQRKDKIMPTRENEERIRNYEMARRAHARMLQAPPTDREAALRNWTLFVLAVVVLWWVGPCL